MGFFDNLKKGAKSYIDKYKKTSADNRAYRNEVNDAVKKAKRKAFKKEAVRQAQLRAKIQAKQKFNPNQQASGFGGGMSAEAGSIIYGSGFGSPQQPAPKGSKKKKKGLKKKKNPARLSVEEVMARLPQ
jgi:hypothetical protein